MARFGVFLAIALTLILGGACGKGAGSGTREIERVGAASPSASTAQLATEVEVVRLSRQDYYRRVEVTVNSMIELFDLDSVRYAPVLAGITEAETLSDARVATQDFLDLLIEDLRAFSDEMSEFTGPADVSRGHQDCVDLLQEAITSAESAWEAVQGSGQFAELDEVSRSARNLARSVSRIGPGGSGPCDELLTAAQEAFETPEPTRPPPTRNPYDLQLVSFSCERSSQSFQRVEGFVKNVSGEALEDVEAVVAFEDGDGVPFMSGSALIDYDPLLPGQSSPYTVIARYNPAISFCSITFREFLGGTLSTNYDQCRGCTDR